jgi:hypothetical protein
MEPAIGLATGYGRGGITGNFPDIIGKFEIEDGFVRTITAGCQVIHGAMPLSRRHPFREARDKSVPIGHLHFR